MAGKLPKSQRLKRSMFKTDGEYISALRAADKHRRADHWEAWARGRAERVAVKKRARKERRREYLADVARREALIGV